MNSEMLLQESLRAEFNPLKDYQDMLIQYSFVLMFTVVWPYISLCALLNNVIELRGDAFKLFHNHRRPMPRSTAGIGHWRFILLVETMIAVTWVVYVGCYSSGQLEVIIYALGVSEKVWGSDCLHKHVELMSKEAVFASSGTECMTLRTRTVFFFIIEHVSALLLFIVYNNSTRISKDLQSKGLKVQRDVEAHLSKLYQERHRETVRRRRKKPVAGTEKA